MANEILSTGKRLLTVNKGGAWKEYTGEAPIIVDNDNNTIKLDDAWKKSVDDMIEAWTKIEPEKIEAWTKIPLPPSDEESKNKMYGWKNGAWTVINTNIVDGKHTKVVTAGDDKIQIDVDISPDNTIDGCLDFTN